MVRTQDVQLQSTILDNLKTMSNVSKIPKISPNQDSNPTKIVVSSWDLVTLFSTPFWLEKLVLMVIGIPLWPVL